MDDQQDNKTSREEFEAIFTYGFVAVVVGGGAGVYLPLLMGKELSSDSLATYIFAVLAPFWVDALLHESYWNELSKAIRMRIGLGCAFAALLGVVALIRDGKSWNLTSGLFGSLIVLVLWFFLARYSGRFRPEPPRPPKGSLGGNELSPARLDGGGLPTT
ncbi:MAG: hypothetical protein U1A72_07510 [Sulfuritalea sp.]|nr:hypothetical protein [Sulfuritalea sp.]